MKSDQQWSVRIERQPHRDAQRLPKAYGQYVTRKTGKLQSTLWIPVYPCE
jgi:hypothetical protein